jgi:hypothetical protein
MVRVHLEAIPALLPLLVIHQPDFQADFLSGAAALSCRIPSTSVKASNLKCEARPTSKIEIHRYRNLTSVKPIARAYFSRILPLMNNLHSRKNKPKSETLQTKKGPFKAKA